MKVVENLDLTPFNSYRVNAVCKRAFFPESIADLEEIFTRYGKTKKIILGSGHNIILAKEFYEDDFILFAGNFNNVEIKDDIITAESGIDLLSLSEKALENSLSGMEMFYDIPSSLGGAVVMNAGAGGEDIKSLLFKASYFDPYKLSFHTLMKEEINFEYRNSFFQKNPHLIITQAVLKLKFGNKKEILEKMERIREQRWEKQPREFPNAGSVFKRPEGYYVGAIMDELGLKGYTSGGAQISKKHGGFIINTGTATGKDILDIINHVQAEVIKKYGFELEVEQRII